MGFVHDLLCLALGLIKGPTNFCLNFLHAVLHFLHVPLTSRLYLRNKFMPGELNLRKRLLCFRMYWRCNTLPEP
jgi:hypothetical protein